MVPMMLLSAAINLLGAFVLQANIGRYVGIFAGTLVSCVIGVYILRFGKIRLAAYAVIGLGWILTTVMCITGGGFQSPIFILFSILSYAAGVLLGKEALFRSTILTILTMLVIAILDANELLPPSSLHLTPYGLFINFTSLLVLVWSLQHIFANSLNQALEESRVELTSRKKAEEALRESESRFRSLYDNATIGLYRTTPDGRILMANPAIVRMLEYESLEDLLKRNLNSGMYGPSFDRSQFCERLEREEVISGLESVWLQTDGTKKYVRENAKVVRDDRGRVLFYDGTVEDITAQKLALDEIHRAEREAEEASRLKSTLLANMSHEFRTPITGILGYADILLEELGDSALVEMVDGIIVSGKRLHLTLNSIMELARLSSHPYPMHPDDVPLGMEISRVVKEFEQLARSKGLVLYLEPPKEDLYVTADRDMLRIVLENLLDNSLKFTREGSVTVSMRTEDNGDGLTAICEFRDTGIGIAPEDQAMIFEDFKQVSEGLSRSHEGSGIGLAIVRKMVDLMHCSIKVESTPGTGSVFALRFPATRIFQNEAPPSVPAAGRTAKPLVLLIEDNYINAKVIDRDLQDVCILEHAPSGAAALTMAALKSYDAILTDINLGAGINGTDVTASLRKNPIYFNAPIAAVTGYTSAEDKASFFKRGFTHFLPKPFDKEDIVELVRSMTS
jgi:PAS domain S-box-containing protein